MLRGKSEGIDAYSPVRQQHADHALISDYEAAYRLMASASPQAPEAFQGLRERYPDDSLIALHADRLAAGERNDLIEIRRK